MGQIKPQENDKASGIQKSPLHKTVKANTTSGRGTGMEHIKMAVTEAPNEVIQKQGKKQRSEWWDEDCQLTIRRKNEARRKVVTT